MKTRFLFALIFQISTFCIASVTPDSGAPHQTLDITIVGSGLNFNSGGADAKLCYYGQASALIEINDNNITVVNDTTITANFTLDQKVGQKDVKVYSSSDGWVTLTPKFTTLASSVTANPNTATTGQQLNITITGSNTAFTSGVSSVQLIGTATQTTHIYGTNISVTNDTTATVDISVPTNAVLTNYDLCVVVNGTMVCNNNYFEITSAPNAISIDSLSPNVFAQGDTTGFSIYGKNIPSGISGYTVRKNGKVITSGTVNFGTSNLSSGTISLPEHSLYGTSCEVTFYYGNDSIQPVSYITITDNVANNPNSASLSPKIGDQGQQLDITITGGNNSAFSAAGHTFELYQSGTSTTTITGSNVNIVNDSTAVATFNIGQSDPTGFYTLKINTDIYPNLSVDSAFFVNPSSSSIGTISGTISNQTGPTTNTYYIRLFDAATDQVLKVVTNAGQSQYSFTDIPAGNYYIEVESTTAPTDTFLINIDSGQNISQSVDLEINDRNLMITNDNEAFIQKLKVFPNPFSENLTIVGLNGKTALVSVVGPQGQFLFQTIVEGKNQASLNLASLSSGIYTVVINSAETSYSEKVLKN